MNAPLPIHQYIGIYTCIYCPDVLYSSDALYSPKLAMLGSTLSLNRENRSDFSLIYRFPNSREIVSENSLVCGFAYVTRAVYYILYSTSEYNSKIIYGGACRRFDAYLI